MHKNYLGKSFISENCPFFSLRHTTHVQINHAVTSAENAENPCSNGGTCIELYHHAEQKFNCAYAIGYVGKFCGKKKSPTSCK